MADPLEPRSGLSPRLLRFAVVGLSGVFVNLGTLHVFAQVLGLPRLLASGCAIEVSILSNFLLNDLWTFRDRAAEARPPLVRLFRYNLAALVGLAIQLGVFEAACQLGMWATGRNDPGWLIYPAQLLGIAVATGWNFTSSLHWTWARSPDRAPEASS